MDAPPRPCVICGTLLEPVDTDWEFYQPSGGVEIQLIGSYGSKKFDDNIHATVFRGVVCDECAEKLVPKMDKVTDSP